MTTPDEPACDVRTAWGQQKRQRSLSLTDVCWQLLTEQACAEGTNRSDLIERWARSASPQGGAGTRVPVSHSLAVTQERQGSGGYP